MDVLSEISQYNTHRAQLDRQRAALLVIDMQEFFNDIGQAIVPSVASLIQAARQGGVPVIFTRHGHHDLAVDGGVLAPWWDFDLSMYGTPQWQIMSGLQPDAGDFIVDKTRYSAFFGTGLGEYLSSHGIRDLVISGVMTNCCCETTAREGFMRDYRIFVAADGTATEHAALHISSLKGMAYACAYINSVASLVASLNGTEADPPSS